MKKKNKRSYFRKAENVRYKDRRDNLLKYIPKQPKLIQFLIDNKADEGFIIALQETDSYTRSQAFRRVDVYDSICSSFTWINTKEGLSYWSELSDKYNKWIRDN